MYMILDNSWSQDVQKKRLRKENGDIQPTTGYSIDYAIKLFSLYWNNQYNEYCKKLLILIFVHFQKRLNWKY